MCERRFKIGEEFKADPAKDARCDSCNTDQAILRVFEYPPFHHMTQELPGKMYDRGADYDIEQIMLLCDFCATTFCSKNISYPGRVDTDIAYTMSAIAYSHNAIMAELSELRAKIEEHLAKTNDRS